MLEARTKGNLKAGNGCLVNEDGKRVASLRYAADPGSSMSIGIEEGIANAEYLALAWNNLPEAVRLIEKYVVDPKVHWADRCVAKDFLIGLNHPPPEASVVAALARTTRDLHEVTEIKNVIQDERNRLLERLLEADRFIGTLCDRIRDGEPTTGYGSVANAEAFRESLDRGPR